VPDGFPGELTIVDGDVVSSVDTPDGAMVTVAVDDAIAAFDDAVADLEGNGWTRDQIDALVADPIEFTGAAVAQTRAVVARVEALAARHPDAAAYVPGAIL
jgi:hypothetical protein